jgi:hypothetical protein
MKNEVSVLSANPFSSDLAKSARLRVRAFVGCPLAIRMRRQVGSTQATYASPQHETGLL